MSKKCRFCDSLLELSLVDLGQTPLANNYLKKENIGKESFHPLHALVCEQCFLVQLSEVCDPSEIFEDYAYFSSFSKSWLEHAKKYADQITQRFSLTSESHVIEAASNDGYLLQFFKEKGIGILGIEPAKNVAAFAQEKGIDTVSEFLGKETAEKISDQYFKADLVVANNVLAHVPDINDFTAGLVTLLKSEGVVTIEFPHLLSLIKFKQFDTIYHEHFSYLSLNFMKRLFAKHGLRVFDVETLPSHGGSLRVYGAKIDSKHQVTQAVEKIVKLEQEEGLETASLYESYTPLVEAVRSSLLQFLEQAKKDGKKVAAYGAPAKGNTLLNYCGVNQEQIAFTVDLNPEKQNRFLPGSHIPVFSPDKIIEEKPDFILLLPWNLEQELAEQLKCTREWGCQLLVPIPELRVVERS